MDSNLFWCVAGIIGGAIFSLIISYLFYLKGQNRKRLTYEIQTFCIISNKINQIQELEVKYNSSEIDNLYYSTITIKNIGNSIVKEQDLIPSCPISILTSGQFLNDEPYRIESLPANKITHYRLSPCEIEGACNCIEFNFDYIPKKAVITFSLFHTGDITLNGNLMDGEMICDESKITDNFFKHFILVMSSFTLGCILGCFLSCLLCMHALDNFLDDMVNDMIDRVDDRVDDMIDDMIDNLKQ